MASTTTDTDWTRLWASPDMQALRRDRRAFFAVAWTLFGAGFTTLIGVSAFAKQTMGSEIVDGLSVGLVLALAYITIVMVVTFWYVQRARVWDAMAARAIAGTRFTSRAESADA
ncbi:DUF485 domain-containing protein [Rhodococcus sp. NPDC127530]|uniref:DUF485 domain-containing protein n=1 Tax=unclassified Rhodococcus (in: high G+C Gram-positive bacteria) TaxID=192944 RepID=UPI00362BBDB3